MVFYNQAYSLVAPPSLLEEHVPGEDERSMQQETSNFYSLQHSYFSQPTELQSRTAELPSPAYFD